MGNPIIPDPFENDNIEIPDPFENDSVAIPDPYQPTQIGLLQRGFNALNNMRKLLGSTHSMFSGLVTEEEKQEVWQALEARPKFGDVTRQVGSNLRNMSFEGVGSAIADAPRKVVSAIWNDPVDAAKTAGSLAVQIPIAIASAATIDPLKALFGVTLTDETIQPLSTEDRAQVMQSVAGDALATVTGVGVSKMLGKARGAVASARVTEEAAFNTLNPAKGRLARAITDDVTAATVAGITQGAVAGAGQEDQVQQITMGLLFAPLGVATGYFRSLKGPDHVESIVTERATNYLTNQLQKSRDGSIAEIHAASYALTSTDNIAAAVLRKEVTLKDDAIGVLPEVDPETLNSISNQISSDLGGVVTRPRSDGTLDVLFWGKARSMNQKDINHWIQNGALAPNPDAGHAGLVTRYQGNEYFIDRVVGDNVVLRDRDGSKFTVNKTVVPLADVRPYEVLPENVVDRLYNDFANDYLNANNQLSFNDNLINFAAKHNLVDQISALAHVFERRIEDYMKRQLPQDELDNWNRVKADFQKVVELTAQNDVGDLHQAAHSNGLYVHYENGKFVVKEHGSAEVLGEATSTKDALAIINGIGQKVGSNLNPPTSAPPGIFSGAPPAHAQAPYQVQSANSWFGKKIEALAKKVDDWATRFDATHPGYTVMVAWTEGTDQINGTSLKTDVYIPTQQAARQAKYEAHQYMTSPRMQTIQGLMKGMDQKQLEEISAVRESMTAAEIMAKGGLAKDYEPSRLAVKVAHEFAKNGIRFEPVLKTRRAIFNLDQEFQSIRAKARFDAEQLIDANNFGDQKIQQNRITYLEAKELAGQNAAKAWDGEYNRRLKLILEQEYDGKKLEPEELKALKLYDSLAQVSEFEIYAATRLAQSLRDPKTAGKGRAELIKEKGWKPGSKEITLMQEIDNAYDELARVFNIDDARKINNYMNHYRSFGDPNDTFGMDRFLTGLESNAARKFVSDMVRTGELEHFESNAALALQQYVSAGFKAKRLYPALDRARESIAYNLGKIKNESARKQALLRFVEYERELTGQRNLEARTAEAYSVEFLKQLGLADVDIIKELRKPDTLDTAISLTSAGLMGARPMMGMRDMTDVIGKYYILYGAKRTKNMMKQRISKKEYEWLKKEGIVDDITFEEFYNPGLRASWAETGVAGFVGRKAEQAADLGFRTSLQPHAFKRAQAATYIEQHNYIRDALNDFMYGRNGLDTKEKLYKKLRISKHDEAFIREFDARISAGNVQEATKFLAKEETRFIAGTFGMGNHPSINSKFGRVFNQMGMWSVANRSIYAKMLFRGDATEVGTSLARYATAQTAIWTAGRLAGVNMASWLTTPASFVFTGGPLISLARETSAAVTSFGGDDRQSNYANREAARAAWMLVPFGYAFKDWQAAFELSQWADPQYTVLQALGFKVSEQYMFEGLFD